MLDPFVSDWSQDEALGFAKLALKCAKLRRKDTPDLGKLLLKGCERSPAAAIAHVHRRVCRTIPYSTKLLVNTIRLISRLDSIYRRGCGYVCC